MNAPRRGQKWHPLYHDARDWLIRRRVLRPGKGRAGWLHDFFVRLDGDWKSRYYRRAAAHRKGAA